MDVLTVGASNVNAFAGVNGPYWTDMDGSGDISWVDEDGMPMDPGIADLDQDGIVDPDETAELSESAVGLSLENVVTNHRQGEQAGVRSALTEMERLLQEVEWS